MGMSGRKTGREGGGQERDEGQEVQFNAGTYLLIYSINLAILRFNLASHVDSHVAEVADHCRHLTHVVLHLFLSIVVGDSGGGANGRSIQ